jgi:hypothetical protein
MANSNGWGDGAGNNAIGWGQGANNNIGWGASHSLSNAGLTDIVGVTTDPASSAFFSATGLTGATQQSAVDALVKGLKTDGLWSKMKAVYPFVTDNRNLLSYTEDFSNGFWSKLNTTVTNNSTTAPDGTLTADALFETVTNSWHGLETANAYSMTNGSAYTQTIYVKPIGRRYVAFTTQWLGGTTIGAWFDTQNVSVFSTDAGVTASITTANNGFYRLTITRTSNNSTGYTNIFLNNSTPTAGVYITGNTYVGDVTKGVYLWGAQLELGSTATTYQPIATTQQAYISSQFKYNLINPVDSDAAFRLVFNGGWTHSSTGATPNGTNGYADTKLNDSSLTPNSSHMSYYSRTNALTATYEMGIYNGTKGIWYALRNSSTSSFTGGIFQLGTSLELSVLNLDSTGHYIGGKNGSTTVKFYKNGTSVATGAKADATATNTSIYLATLNQNGTPAFGFSTKQVAFSTIGDGLTDTEAANLYSRVQQFQTTLNRNI